MDEAEARRLLEQWNRICTNPGPGDFGGLQDIKQSLVNWAKANYGPAAGMEMGQDLDESSASSNPVPGDLIDQYGRNYTKTAPVTKPETTQGANAVDPNAQQEVNLHPSTVGDEVYRADPGDGRNWLQGNLKLPTLSAADEMVIKARDVAITQMNTSNFNVDPEKAWMVDDEDLQLPVAHTGDPKSDISTLGNTYEKLSTVIPQWVTLIDTLQKAISDANAEPFIAQQTDGPVKEAVNSLATAAESSNTLLAGSIARAGTAANDQFHKMRGEELNMRTKISDIVKEMVTDAAKEEARASFYKYGPGFQLDTAAPINIKDEKFTTASEGKFTDLPEINKTLDTSVIATETDAINKLAGTITKPEAVDVKTISGTTSSTTSTNSSGTDNNSGTPASPAATAPSGSPTQVGSPSTNPSTTSPTGSPKSTESGDEGISDLLSKLGGSDTPQAAAGAGTPAAGGAEQAAQPAAAGGQEAAQAAQEAAQTPQELLKSLSGAVPGMDQLAGPPDAESAERDAGFEGSTAMPAPALPRDLGLPGSDARPHQLDATGKPVDKDGDGKVDKDAAPLSKKTVKPFDLDLKARGENVKVEGVLDPRLGEMMLNLADGTEDSPVSVLEAAKESGMDLTSLGDTKDPEDVEVGDAVVGDEMSGMYIGDGQVLTSTGDVMDIDDVLGEDGSVSEIPLPELPDDVPAPPDGAGDPGAPGAPADGELPQQPAPDAAAGGEAPAADGAAPEGPPPGGTPPDPNGPPPMDGPPPGSTPPDGAEPPAGSAPPQSDPGANAQTSSAPPADGPAAVGTGGLTLPGAGPAPAPAVPAPVTPEPAPTAAPASAPAGSDTPPDSSGLPRKVEYEGHALG